MAHRFKDILPIADFKKLPEKDQKIALTYWRRQHKPRHIANVMGVSIATYYYQANKLGIKMDRRTDLKSSDTSDQPKRAYVKKEVIEPKSSYRPLTAVKNLEPEEPVKVVREDHRQVFTFGGNMTGTDLATKLEAIGLLFADEGKKYAVQISLREVDEQGMADLVPEPVLFAESEKIEAVKKSEAVAVPKEQEIAPEKPEKPAEDVVTPAPTVVSSVKPEVTIRQSKPNRTAKAEKTPKKVRTNSRSLNKHQFKKAKGNHFPSDVIKKPDDVNANVKAGKGARVSKLSKPVDGAEKKMSELAEVVLKNLNKYGEGSQDFSTQYEDAYKEAFDEASASDLKGIQSIKGELL